MTSENEQKTYRTIVASTAAFGGAQAFNVFVNVVRGKFVAHILGKAGMGMSALFGSSAAMLQQFSSLGINTSAVRDISAANASADPSALALTIGVVRRLMLMAALLGVVATVGFSPLIARSAFGGTDAVPQILLMGAAVLFNVLAAGEFAILQGLRRYRDVAVSSTVVPLAGLLLGVPLYYIYGTRGIVPAMILTAFAYYAALRLLSRRATRGLPSAAASRGEVWARGRGIIIMGLLMTIAAVLGSATTYGVSAFISHAGSLADVGLYNAANAITLQYTGLVFTAMAADYYPHLSALLSRSCEEALALVSRQTEIVLLAAAPLAMLIILTAPLLISLLLTREFLPIQSMMRFMGLAVVLKALCVPVDYISLSKGDRRFFFWVEGVWGNAKTLAVITSFYYFFGLDGIGPAALVSGVIDVAVCYALNHRRYGFRPSPVCLRLSLTLLALTAATFGFAFVPSPVLSYALMGLTTAAGIVFSLWQLNRRIDVRGILRRKFLQR